MPSFKRKTRVSLAIALLILTISIPCRSVARQLFVIRYPASDNSHYQQKDRYFIELLELALTKADQAFFLLPVTQPDMVEARSMQNLSDGLYDVHWLMANKSNEVQLLPVRVPLFKGLIGWRVLTVRQNDLSRFSGITDVEKLKALTAVQGHDWPDRWVLESNGFTTVVSTHLPSLYSMLINGRADFFPRSVIEVWQELEEHYAAGVKVEPHLLLKYPAAYFFFVSKEHPELQQILESGLQRALKDGDFDRLFTRYFGRLITRSDLLHRKIFTLTNVDLPKSLPVENADLWYSPTTIPQAISQKD